MKLSIAQRLAGGFCLTLIIPIMLGWASYQNTKYQLSSYGRVLHSQEVIFAEKTVLSDLKDAETSQRGYLITGDAVRLVPYQAAAARVEASLLKLRMLTAGDSAKKGAIDELQYLAHVRLSQLHATEELRRNQGFAEAQAVVMKDAGRPSMERLAVVIGLMKQQETNSLWNQEAGAGHAYRNAMSALLVGALLVFGVVLVSGVAMVRGITVPINRLAQGAEAIGSGSLEHRIPKAATGSSNELNALAAVFNSMAQKLQDRNELLQLHKQELEKRNQEVQRATHLKSEFLASMSHELRTPLNAILGFSELLSNQTAGPLADKQRRFVEHIHSAGSHLLKLINDILDLSKIEAGKVEFSYEHFLLDGAIEEVLENLAPLARGEFKIETLDGHDIRVYTDRFRFKQVLYNLLSNAIKFSPLGENILIETSIRGQFAMVAVEDHGPGIKPEDQEVIFEEFRQVGGAAAAVKSGTGLGLAITRRLVEQQGGIISVHSEFGHGSRFTFSVPLGSLSGQAETGPAQPVRREVPVVLVVDHEATSRELLAGYLAPGGYQVEVAADTQDALQKANAILPDAIILNIQMPGNSGWDTLQKLRDNPATASIPVIIVSGVDRDDPGLRAGASDYLPKPVQRDALLDSVRKNVYPCTRRTCHCLVVDDEYENRMLVAEYLQSVDMMVTMAGNGKEALAAMEHLAFDFIVLDLKMPEMDGFALLRHLRADPAAARIPVLVVTSKDLTIAEEKFLTRHTSALVQKGNDLGKNLLAHISRTVGPRPAQLSPLQSV